MTVYFAGGDPEHLLKAYLLAKEEKQTYGYVSTDKETGKAKLRTLLEPDDTLILVGNEDWFPYLRKLAQEHGCSIQEEVVVPSDEWTVPFLGE